MECDDYYQLLGVSRRASDEAVKAAFRARVRELHPDLHPADSGAADRTRRVIEAYNVLRTPQLRRHYDSSLVPVDPPAPAAPLYRQSRFTRYWVFPVAIMLFILLAGAFWAAAERNQPPVFRANLITQDYLTPPLVVADVIEPDLLHDCSRWYAVRQFSTSFAADWALSGAVRAYTEAADRAAARGDFRAERFYRAGVNQFRTTSVAAL